MTQVFDTIVAGIGGMGSAALYHLSRRGQRVLGLERFALGHARGSSHGETRIIRMAYFEGGRYVPLLRRTYRLWNELSAAANTPLIYRTGSLEMSEPGFDFADRSRASCIEHGLAHTMLDAGDVMQRFPAFRLAPKTTAIFQPDGGYVLSEAAIAAHARLAIDHGAQLHTGETVLDFKPTAHGGVEVRTNRARYTAGHLVLSAGPWLSQLVPDLAQHLATFKQTIAWYHPQQPRAFEPAAFPVFIHFSDRGEFYGIPMHSARGLKVGGPHFGRVAIDPDAPDRDPTAAQLSALAAFMTDCLPGAAVPPIETAGCIYTKTPDEDFIIDHHPSMPQVLVVSPCSGHGFKFAPVIGEIVAQWAVDGAIGHDLSPFTARRFAA